MARSNKPVNQAAENALDRMKLEIASELGIAERVRTQGWASMPSADCGRVGGHMVRRMIEQYENSMTSTAGATNTTATAGTAGLGATGATAGATGATAGATGALGNTTMTSQFDVNNQS